MREHQCYDATTGAWSDLLIYWPWKSQNRKSEQEIKAEVQQRKDLIHEEWAKTNGLRDHERKTEAAAMMQEAQRRADERLSDAEKHRYNEDDSDGPDHVGPRDTDSVYSETDTVPDGVHHQESDSEDNIYGYSDEDPDYDINPDYNIAPDANDKAEAAAMSHAAQLRALTHKTEAAAMSHAAHLRALERLRDHGVPPGLTPAESDYDYLLDGGNRTRKEWAELGAEHHNASDEDDEDDAWSCIRHAMQSLLGEEKTIGKLQKFASHEAARATAATAKATKLRHVANQLMDQANKLELSPGSVMQSAKKKAEKLAAARKVAGDARKEDLNAKKFRKLAAAACTEVACVKRMVEDTKKNVKSDFLAQIYKPELRPGQKKMQGTKNAI